jgi:hypothetical protein
MFGPLRALAAGTVLTTAAIAGLAPAAAFAPVLSSAAAGGADSWHVTTFTPRKQPAAANVADIAASGAANAWAVGTVAPFYGAPGFSFVYRWNGTHWLAERIPAKWQTDFSYVGSTSASDAWLLGSGRGDIGLHWNGHEWTAATLPTIRGIDVVETGAVLSSRNVWAFGNYQARGVMHPYMAHLAGRSWTREPAPASVQRLHVTISTASAVSATDIWALASSTSTADPVAPRLIHWNGSRWSTVRLPAGLITGQWYQLLATSPSSLWIAGAQDQGGAAVIWHRGVSGWTSATVPLASGDSRVDVEGITPDNHGGVLVLGFGYPSDVNRIWDLRDGAWTGPTSAQWPEQSSLTGISAVPGSSAIFVYGNDNGAGDTTPVGAIGRYGP